MAKTRLISIGDNVSPAISLAPQPKVDTPTFVSVDAGSPSSSSFGGGSFWNGSVGSLGGSFSEMINNVKADVIANQPRENPYLLAPVKKKVDVLNENKNKKSLISLGILVAVFFGLKMFKIF